MKRSAELGSSHPWESAGKGLLAKVDLSARLGKSRYHEQLSRYQAKLQDAAWDAHAAGVATVAVFEGWDAAGKGSAIRRVTGGIDPRLYQVLQTAAPTDEESAHHYLWRFWRKLERDGRSTLFDRSWYGRVLVERVEGFASPAEWQRAFDEINEFERQLVAHGSVLLKFWLHISPEEQLRRFEEREARAHKRYKITAEDWRNREKWPAYEIAVEDMLARTDTDHAPWTVIEANDKRHARIQILKTFCKTLRKRLEPNAS
jgi:polyphosphate kinase 2 (PPK2 family)